MPSAQEIQDAMLLINAFEEQSMHAMSEESALIPVARVVNNMMSHMSVMDKTFTPPQQLADDVMAKGGAGLNQKLQSYLGNKGLELPPDAGTQTDTSNAVGGQANNKAANYAMSYLTDCIPCLDRMRQFSLYTRGYLPIDVFNAILKDLEDRLMWLLEVLDILGNTEIWGDLCSLAEFLSFMCIQDLVGLLVLLSATISKYNVMALSKLNLLPGYWISNMFYMPFMIALYGVIRSYANQALGIVKCISNGIDTQLNKLDITRLSKEDQRLFDWNKDTTKNETAEAIKKARTTVRKTDDAIGDSLNYLLEGIEKGFGFVTTEMHELEDAILAFFSGGDVSNWSITEFVRTKIVLARLIGFIRFFIELATDRAQGQIGIDANMGGLRGARVKCSTPDQAYQNMLDEFHNLFVQTVGGHVTAQRDDQGNITDLSWSPIPNPDEFGRSVREYFDHFADHGDKSAGKQAHALTDDPDDKTTIHDKLTELASKKVTISCKNIGALFSQEDLAKTQEWLNDLLQD